MTETVLQRLSLLFIAIFLFSFSLETNVLFSGRTYESVKADIHLKRKGLDKLYQSSSGEAEKSAILKEAGSYLLQTLRDTVFSYWYGTPWDFNGYTDQPGQGIVACGYFVSTPLKHCGFNLNRFKLAQKHAFDIVKSLSCGDTMISFRGISRDEFIARTRNKLDDGLYVIGLDYHVGFLLYEKDEIYFIHSSYRDPVAVVKEKAPDSAALNDSKVFILCRLTGNERLMERWVKGEVIN